MDTITVDFGGSEPITIDVSTIEPDIIREALTRGLTEMFTERYEEASANLARDVLAGMTAETPPSFRKVA